MQVPKRSEMSKCVVVDLFNLKKGQVQIQGKFIAVTVRMFEDRNLQCKRWLVFMAKGHPGLAFGDTVYISNARVAYVDKGITLYNLHATGGLCTDILAKLVSEVFNTGG